MDTCPMDTVLLFWDNELDGSRKLNPNLKCPPMKETDLTFRGIRFKISKGCWHLVGGEMVLDMGLGRW